MDEDRIKKIEKVKEKIRHYQEKIDALKKHDLQFEVSVSVRGEMEDIVEWQENPTGLVEFCVSGVSELPLDCFIKPGQAYEFRDDFVCYVIEKIDDNSMLCCAKKADFIRLVKDVNF